MLILFKKFQTVVSSTIWDIGFGVLMTATNMTSHSLDEIVISLKNSPLLAVKKLMK